MEQNMTVDIGKLTRAELDALIEQANVRKQQIDREEMGKVREEVIEFARSRGYSIEELFGKARRGGGKRGSVAPKYRNPDDHSQVWTGRGKPPRWFKALIDAGTAKTSLLIR
ncbi:hypothetical protein B1808_11070 [Pseudofulvimonas gallinarii]|jgi:DNA-binding protein H-NS|nr:hypothetical protein B1808_11070 [Pseudofulvimonas gallinarii]